MRGFHTLLTAMACAVTLGSVVVAQNQGSSSTDERLQRLENMVERLARENADLRSTVSELRAESEDDAQREVVETLLNRLAQDQENAPHAKERGDELYGIVKRMEWGAEWRTRGDWRINTADLLDELDDEGFRLDYRFNLGVGFRLIHDENPDNSSVPVRVRTWFEMQSAGRAANNTAESLQSSTGVSIGDFATRNNDLDEIRLYQAYIRLDDILGVEGLSLQIGRQEINLGNQLIMGTNEFFTGTVHDGVRLDFDVDALTAAVTMFYAKEAASDGQVPPGLASGGLLQGQVRGSGDEDDLFGIYSRFRFLEPVTLDLYYIYFRGRDSSGGTTPTNVTSPSDPALDAFGRSVLSGDIHTLGFLAYTSLDMGLYLSLEVAYQIGSPEDYRDAFTGAPVSAGNVGAFGIDFTADYALPFMEDVAPRAYFGFYWAEGPEDDTANGFSPLYVSRHNNDPVHQGRFGSYSRLGNIDLIPTQNIFVIQAGFKFQPVDPWTVGITYLYAWLHHSREAIAVNSIGNVFLDDRSLGHEVDLYAVATIANRTQLMLNLSVFIPEADLVIRQPSGLTTHHDTDIAFGLFAQIRIVF